MYNTTEKKNKQHLNESKVDSRNNRLSKVLNKSNRRLSTSNRRLSYSKRRLTTSDLKHHARNSDLHNKPQPKPSHSQKNESQPPPQRQSQSQLHHFAISDGRMEQSQRRFCFCCIKYDGRIVCARKDKTPPRKIPILSRLLLSPYEKWHEYGVVPFKAILHVFLSVLIIVSLSVWDTQDGMFLRHASESTCRIVMPESYECGHGGDIFADELNGFHLYTQDDFLNSLEQAVHGVDAYFTGQKHTLDGSYFIPVDTTLMLNTKNISHINFQMTYTAITEKTMEQMTKSWSPSATPATDDGSSSPATKKVIQMIPVTKETKSEIITSENLSLFDRTHLLNNTIRDNVMRLVTLQLRGKMHRYHFVDKSIFGDESFEHSAQSVDIAQCTEWVFDLHWDFRSRGIIVLSFDDYVEGDCVASSGKDGSAFPEIFSVRHAFELLQCIVSILVFILNGRGILRRCTLVRTIRIDVDPITNQLTVIHREDGVNGSETGNEVPQSSSPQPSCFSFIPYSHWALAIGTACIAVKSSTNLYYGNARLPSKYWYQVCTSIGVLLTCYLTRRYMETRGDNGTYVLFAVLDNALPKILLFLFSCFPIFFGFAGAGVVLFNDKIRLFSDMSRAMMTLFCTAHGDSLISVFDAVWWSHGLLGYIYLYIWISLVIFVVLNILLTIIIASYDDIMKEKKNENHEITGMSGMSADEEDNQNGGGTLGGILGVGSEDVRLARILSMATNINPDEKNIRPLTKSQFNVLNILAGHNK
jgi:hypothetical protein